MLTAAPTGREQSYVGCFQSGRGHHAVVMLVSVTKGIQKERMGSFGAGLSAMLCVM